MWQASQKMWKVQKKTKSVETKDTLAARWQSNTSSNGLSAYRKWSMEFKYKLLILTILFLFCIHPPCLNSKTMHFGDAVGYSGMDSYYRGLFHIPLKHPISSMNRRYQNPWRRKRHSNDFTVPMRSFAVGLVALLPPIIIVLPNHGRGGVAPRQWQQQHARRKYVAGHALKRIA